MHDLKKKSARQEIYDTFKMGQLLLIKQKYYFHEILELDKDFTFGRILTNSQGFLNPIEPTRGETALLVNIVEKSIFTEQTKSLGSDYLALILLYHDRLYASFSNTDRIFFDYCIVWNYQNFLEKRRLLNLVNSEIE